jgi:branched-chain amino acid transport system permease protein
LARAGLLHRLALPYLRILLPGLVMLFGFVGMVELLSFLTIGMAEGKRLSLLGHAIDIAGPAPWLIALACLVAGGGWLAVEARHFRRIWGGLIEAARSS